MRRFATALGLLLIVGVFVALAPASAQDMQMECFDSAGSTIAILGPWSGEEEDTFRSILNPLLEACDISLSYEGTREMNTVLATRVEGNAAPDIAVLSNPGAIVNYADDLVPLSELEVNADNYVSGWVERGSVDGTWYGLPVKTDIKSLVWYSPANFDAFGYSVPETWDEFTSLLETMNESDFAPLAMGVESGGATGWPATDWVQDLLLRQEGTDFVSGLITGETDWNNPAVVEAWQQYVNWAEMYNPGGVDGALTTSFRDAILMPFQDPPEAWMVKQSGFAGTAVIQPNFEGFTYGEDFAFFVLPGQGGDAAPMQVGGDFMVAFNNNPAVNAVMHYLSSEQGATEWASAGFDLTPNSAVNVESYESEIDRDKAQALADAPNVSFDVGDSLPAEVGQGEFDAIAEALGGGEVEPLLDDVEQTYTDVVESDGGM